MDTSTVLSVKDELELYMSERPVAQSESPLSWWKGNEYRFPRLAKVARSTLCNPATSTPSERIFSVAGLPVTKLRSCLKPNNVDALDKKSLSLCCTNLVISCKFWY